MSQINDPSVLPPKEPAHFKGKDPLSHVAEAQVEGRITAAEIHGTEISGHLNAGADAARDTALALLLVAIILNNSPISFDQRLLFLLVFGGGWLLWKTGRSAWLGWSRLERLHRVIVQERWEIEHHRLQEREELRALYSAKGFEGKLLEDVLDVLMADGDRLLRVMVEEEMGYSLETHEHPIQQSLGAAVGSLFASLLFGLFYYLNSPTGMYFGAALVISISSGIASYAQRNRVIPSVIWNLGIFSIAVGFVYFALQYFNFKAIG